MVGSCSWGEGVFFFFASVLVGLVSSHRELRVHPTFSFLSLAPWTFFPYPHVFELLCLFSSRMLFAFGLFGLGKVRQGRYRQAEIQALSLFCPYRRREHRGLLGGRLDGVYSGHGCLSDTVEIIKKRGEMTGFLRYPMTEVVVVVSKKATSTK
ncbi:hypothetical protein QBC47DRAFT_7284 [Echria macrotheca]|uniref:Uncharacterized protein n=1 Tax=Echria macrotheca TaxID=438768 RepID=A0AAJ0BLK0_9PEZI|nr:hypothetical protein QBC47DRAFT_7284 [Echria macrotheca]